MTDSLLVILDDAIAGSLTRLPGGKLRFDYHVGYCSGPSPTPLSISMPVQVRSHLPYGMHEKKLRFAMKLGGDYRVFLHRNAWRDAAFELDIDADATVARVETLAVRAPDAFAAAASSDDIVSLQRDLPGRLVDLVAARAVRCVQLLRAT